MSNAARRGAPPGSHVANHAARTQALTAGTVGGTAGVIEPMRVVLVGSTRRRQRLRALLPDSLDVVAEVLTVADARRAGLEPDAYLVAARPAVDGDALVEELTPREAQVLGLLADGLSNRAIAGRLGVSDETVKFHLAAIFGKLHAANRTDAVTRALRRGLIPL